MKDTYISIWDYVVVVLVDDLNVYAEWDLFQRTGVAREEDLSERKEIFIECLMRDGKVRCVTETEVLPEKYDGYFDWFFMRSDPKAASVPTESDMKALRHALGDERYNALSVYDRELFATGFRSDLIREAEMSPEVYFLWVADADVGIMEDKKMTLFRSWFTRNQRIAQERQGFAVQNVFSNDPVDKWVSYSYTYGAQDKLGYEVVLVNAGKNSGAILAQLTTWALETGGFILDIPFEVEGYEVGKPPQPLKAVAVEIDINSDLAQAMLGAKNAGMTRVVQVFVADKNNILPGEEGYDVNFFQEYTAPVEKEDGQCQ